MSQFKMTSPPVMDEVDEYGARGMEVLAPPPSPAAGAQQEDEEEEEGKEEGDNDERRSMQRNKSGSTTMTEASDSNSDSSPSPPAPSSTSNMAHAQHDDADKSAGPPVPVPSLQHTDSNDHDSAANKSDRDRPDSTANKSDRGRRGREVKGNESKETDNEDEGDSDSDSSSDIDDSDEIMVVGSGNLTVTGAAANALPPPPPQRRKFPDEDYIPGGAHNPNPVEASILPLPPNVPRYGQTNRALMPSPLPSPVARRKAAAAAAANSSNSPKKRDTENDEEEAAVREAKRRQREEASVSRLVHMAKQQQSFAAAWFAASGVVPIDPTPAAPANPPRRRSRSPSPARSVSSASSSSSSNRSRSPTGEAGPVDIDTGDFYDNDDDDDDNRSNKSSGSKRKGKLGIFGGGGVGDASSVASGSSRKSSRKAKLDEEMGLGKRPMGAGNPIVFADDDNDDERDATNKGFAFFSKSFKKNTKNRKQGLLLYVLMVLFAVIVVASAAIVTGTVLSRQSGDDGGGGDENRPTSGEGFEGGTASGLPAVSTPTSAPSSTILVVVSGTSEPTVPPPTPNPTLRPSLRPTLRPTAPEPTESPSNPPSDPPSPAPSLAPSPVPTQSPSWSPTTSPTLVPTPSPSTIPSSGPTEAPSPSPSEAPSDAPSKAPTSAPSAVPSIAPSAAPSVPPSAAPSLSFMPSQIPSLSPSTQFAASSLEIVDAAINGTRDGSDTGSHFGFAVDLSADGTILAVGARRQDANETDSGLVEVYRLETDSSSGRQQWVPMGSPLQGVGRLDQFGFAIKMNDAGTRMVVSEPGSARLRGSVRTFAWNGASLQWEQLGQPLLGLKRFDLFGGSLDLSADGNVMVVGAPLYAGVVDSRNIRNLGQVRVYRFDEATLEWNLMGSPLEGETSNDRLGWSVSITGDGSMVAAGAPYSEGYVRVYRFVAVNATWSDWIPVGSGGADSRIFSPVFDRGGLFGASISLSRGLSFDETPRLAIGAPHFSRNQQPEESAKFGLVAVYDLTKTEKWRQVGSSIVGDGSNDLLGWSVALSDEGDLLTVGSPGHSQRGANTGQARVYRWLESANGGDLFEKRGDWDGSQPVGGSARLEDFGLAVTMSADGRTIAVGAPKNSRDNEDDYVGDDVIGYASVYQIPPDEF